MRTTFHNWMLFAAVTSAAVVSSAQAGTLDSNAAAAVLAGTTPLCNRAVGTEDLNVSSGIGQALAQPSNWADGLTAKNLAEASRLQTPEMPQPVVNFKAAADGDDALLSGVQSAQAEGTQLRLSTIDAITRDLLRGHGELSRIMRDRAPGHRRSAERRSSDEARSLIVMMGNGIVREEQVNVNSVASGDKTAAQIDNGEDWNANDPTAEYLDFNYRAYDFKQFLDTNSKTVAVKVDINRMVESTPEVGIELDSVLDSFGQQTTHSSDTLAASLEVSAESLENFAATPEPSSMMMMGIGLWFFGLNSRRQRRRRRA